ncbi:MAG TPA: LTA synthase family protein [Erysipelothrix sp.]|nr:LTA synthase family protein [Erysipelothrix sp.]
MQKQPRPVSRTLYPSNQVIMKLLASSIVISFLLTASVLNLNIFDTLATFTASLSLTLFSIFIIFTMQLLLLSLINELKLTMWLSFLISILVSVVNLLKIQFRSEPLIPTDLGFLFDLPAIIRLITPIQIVLVSLLLLAIIAIILVLVYRQRKFQTGVKIFDIDKQSNYRRGFLLILSFTLLLSMRSYQVEGSLLKKTLTSFGFKEYQFDILKSYRENGFVNGYISNISNDVMVMPEGYSKESVQAIMEKYQAQADTFNIQSKYDNFQDISVVYILSESLSNPQRVNGVEIEENPLPFISDPKGKSLQGLMVSPVYGGTTANTEFEVLTGLSMKYLASGSIIPFKSIIPEFEKFPGIVKDYLRDNPYGKAISLHSYNDKLFKRPEVYEKLGFDQCYFDADMIHQDPLFDSTYISDKSTFNDALAYLSQDGSQFMNVVTMQNHSPFTDKYDALYPGVSVETDPNLEESLAAYTQGIHYSDQAIEEFIQAVSQMDKKVMVVYYGDHLPGLYNSLLDENKDPFDLYTTDFFIYKNFDQDHRQMAKEQVVSASSLNALTHLYARVELSPLHILNLKINQQAVGGSALNYKTKEGTQQYLDLSPELQSMIEEYKMIQYDILVGENYSNQ